MTCRACGRECRGGGGFVSLRDVTGAARGVPVLVDDRFAHANLAADDLAASNDTRPNLKVQDGCGNRCSFCIIPTTRGGSRSVPLQTVLERVQRFVDADGKELVLSGINLGRWGRDFERPARLEDLVCGDSGADGAAAAAHQLGRADGLER